MSSTRIIDVLRDEDGTSSAHTIGMTAAAVNNASAENYRTMRPTILSALISMTKQYQQTTDKNHTETFVLKKSSAQLARR